MARVELLVTVDKIVSSNLQPVSGASVQVNVRATGTPAIVYSGESGGATVSNPLVTDANGRVNGWVEENSYVLVISGSGITSYNQPYEAVRGSVAIDMPGTRITVNTLPGDRLTNASVAGTKIANGAILGKHLHDSALPLGTIIAWWLPTKPGGGFAAPDGWAIMNGQSLNSASHDFPGGGTITLPNLTDKVLRGADASLAYNAAAGAGAGGMNAQWGANSINLSHRHYTDHWHNIPTHSHHVQDHAHYMYHQHGAWVPDHAHGIPITKINSGTSNVTITVSSGSTHGFGGVGITTDPGNRHWTDGNAGIYTDSQSGGTNTHWGSQSGSTDGYSGYSGSATQDVRDASVGVLYLIKVRNTV